MTGLLIGVLAARTLSGAISDLTNWRVVYVFFAAVTMFVLSLACWIELPSSAPTARTG